MKRHIIALLPAALASTGCNGIVSTSDYRFDGGSQGAGATTGSGSASTGGTTTTGGGTDGCADFERPDGSDLGGDWAQKSTQGFVIDGGVLRDDPSGPGAWQNNLVFRDGETAYDMTASVVIRFPNEVSGHPRLVVRAPKGDIDDMGSVHGFVFGLNEGTSGSMAQYDSNTVSSGFMLDEALQVGRAYRLTVAISGSSQPDMEITVDRLEGDGAQTIGQETWKGQSQALFPGTAGLAMDGGGDATFDDFCLTFD